MQSNDVFYEEAKDIKKNEEFDCITPPLHVFQFCLPVTMTVATASPVMTMRAKADAEAMMTTETVFGLEDNGINRFVFNYPGKQTAASAMTGILRQADYMLGCM
jgi:hypothetical protein